MAEIIRALSDKEVSGYMPVCELLPLQQTQVYKVVGNRLIDWYELTGDLPDDGNFLVEVDQDGYQTLKVGFSYEVYDSEPTTYN